jgi:hypothetical protein
VPLLTAQRYPLEEFASIYGEQGFGGLHYTQKDSPDVENCMLFLSSGGKTFNELNTYSQSGWLRMVRKGDWKLLFDMQGRGQLYNLSADPRELENLYDRPELRDVKCELLAELLTWTLRTQDPLPPPKEDGPACKYVWKADPRNYWTPHR